MVSLGKEKSFRQSTVALAEIAPGETGLDVGCGTGSLTLAAKQQAGANGAVYGTDASPEMIAVAQEKAAKANADVTFQVDVVENISFPAGTFDVVLSSFMMHHLPGELKSQGLAEIYRVLKPDGRLVIVDMEATAGGSWFYRMTDFMIQLHGGHASMQNNVTQLLPLVEAAGFKAVQKGRLTRQIAYVAARKVEPAA